MPNGVDPEDLQPVADLPRLRARYAAPDERLVLLVGRLVYEKGFHLALDALPGVIERLGGVRFLVAGSGTAERDLKAQARKLGLDRHGEFLGWIDDAMLHSLYAIADLCVIPSLYEPFGLVALEAMASGCPCIVADTGGLREVVPGGERVGLRFRARDSASLATMMEKVLSDDVLRDRLVAEASEHILALRLGRRRPPHRRGLRGAPRRRVSPRRSRAAFEPSELRPPRARSARVTAAVARRKPAGVAGAARLPVGGGRAFPRRLLDAGLGGSGGGARLELCRGRRERARRRPPARRRPSTARPGCGPRRARRGRRCGACPGRRSRR